MVKAKPKPKPRAKAKAKRKRGPGKPRFRPTVAERKQVETLAGLGIKRDDICLLVVNPTTGQPITAKTLSLHFEKELREGWVKADSMVAQSLFNKATGDGPASVTAAIWWTKARMGWSEIQKHRLAAKNVDQMSEEEIIEFLGGEPTDEELRAFASDASAGGT